MHPLLSDEQSDLRVPAAVIYPSELECRRIYVLNSRDFISDSTATYYNTVVQLVNRCRL